MTTYVVRWEMSFEPGDFGVDSPESAARAALAIHRDPESIATSFDVFIEGESEPILSEFDAAESTPESDSTPPRPTAVCGCGHELIWVEGGWQHNVAPSIWGDDHDADADEEPDPRARAFWDEHDGAVWGNDDEPDTDHYVYDSSEVAADKAGH